MSVVSKWLPRDQWLWLAMMMIGSMLLILSLMRYWGFTAGMLDLGAMSQAIWSVTQGAPLITTGANGQFSRLAGHVEAFYIVLALPYALWPDPQLLLIAQTALFVAGAIPAYRIAERGLGIGPARAIALAYLLYPVAQTAVLFDLHGDTLGMPLLMFALDALDRRAWRSYSIWLIFALSCKFYVAVPVAGLGAMLLLWGKPEDRRVAWATLLGGLAYGAFAFLGMRRIFASPDNLATGNSSSFSYITYYFGNLSELVATFDQRFLSTIVVFGPILFVGWRGWRWLLPALPLAGAALLSTGPGGSFDYRYHHYALVVPFVIMALVDGARRMKIAAEQHRLRRPWRIDLAFNTVIIAIFSILLVDTPLNPLFWVGLPGRGLDVAAYGITERDQRKPEFLREIPDHAPIAASMFLASHLTARETLHVVRGPDDPGGERLPSLLPSVNLVIADALFDWRLPNESGVLGGPLYEQAEIAILLNEPSFGLRSARDGLLIFERDLPADVALAQQTTLLATPTLNGPSAQFGSLLLHGIVVEPLDRQRWRITAEWELTDPESPIAPLIISRLSSQPHERIVHLPSVMLLPSREWGNAILQEQFEIELPAGIDLNLVEWEIGVYDGNHPEAWATDARSQLGERLNLGSLSDE